MASSERFPSGAPLIWCDRHDQTVEKCDTPVVCMAVAKGDMPDEPISQLRADLDPLHEMFVTHMEGGFSAAQAIYLVASMFTGNPGLPPKG